MKSTLPHSSVVEYLDSLCLTGEEQVNVYLAAEHRKALEYPQRGHIYELSVPIEVNGQRVPGQGFPLAQVFQAPECRAYGTGLARVQELRDFLREEHWYPLERILEPFLYQHIPARLEASMSSDSILYVFSGFVEMAVKMAAELERLAKTSPVFAPRITLAGRKIDDDFLSQLHSPTRGMFRGYRIRVAEDVDRLKEAERQERAV